MTINNIGWSEINSDYRDLSMVAAGLNNVALCEPNLAYNRIRAHPDKKITNSEKVIIC